MLKSISSARKTLILKTWAGETFVPKSSHPTIAPLKPLFASSKLFFSKNFRSFFWASDLGASTYGWFFFWFQYEAWAWAWCEIRFWWAKVQRSHSQYIVSCPFFPTGWANWRHMRHRYSQIQIFSGELVHIRPKPQIASHFGERIFVFRATNNVQYVLMYGLWVVALSLAVLLFGHTISLSFVFRSLFYILFQEIYRRRTWFASKS